MSRVLIAKTSFTAGELDPRLLGRLDLKAQEDGAARLRNVLVQATGGVTRRPGLARVAALPGASRLIGFEAPSGPVLVALGHGRIDILREGVLLATLPGAWSEAQLRDIAWARCRDELLLTHPQVAPRALFEEEPGSFGLRTWRYDASDGGSPPVRTHQPYARFAPSGVALELRHPATGETDLELPAGPVDLVASEPVFGALHLGSVFRHRGREVTIVSVQDPTSANGLLHAAAPSGNATRDWDEQAFSPGRGWPATVSVYQDRLVVGGSRDLPDWVWMSRTGRHFDFELSDPENGDEVLDDHGLAFRLAAGGELHAIRALQPGRQLQVFTTAGEWIVRGAPVTPTSAEVELQTRVGSWGPRRVQPVDVDGATLFVGASGRELREYLFAESEQAYQAADIALLARHLLEDPVDMAFDGRRRLLLIARGDGRMAAVTIDRNSNVVAWSLLGTAGRVLAVATHAGEPWFLVDLGGGVTLLERFGDAPDVDHARALQHPTGTVVWTGLDEFEGREVTAFAEDGSATRVAVGAGTIVLARPTRRLVVGMPYVHEVEPMPVAVPTGRGASPDHPYRPVRTSFRVLDTAALRVDVGDGPRPAMGSAGATTAVTGDVAVRALGWRRGLAEPAWRVAQDDPLPSTILSATTELKVND